MDFGLAIDIGTTNIKMAKVCLTTGEVLSELQMKNSQTAFGKDVLSRIRCACEGKKDELTKLVRQDIVVGMQTLAVPETAPVAIACNTTMMALLCGDDVAGMQDFPFKPQRLSVTAQPLIHIAPAAGAFIGGDVVAGCSVLPKENASFLFIDLGTNGEMVLHGKKCTLAVAAAAGPAFEDMVDASGSQLLEVLTEAYEAGVVDETGLLAEPWFETGYLWTALNGSEEFILTQQKIRDVQLAKAAIRTGVEYLQQAYKKMTGDVLVPEQVYLAGGMGIVSEEACIRIGMLPEYLEGKCSFLGNTALQGAIKLLTEPESFQKMQQIAKEVKVHNLAGWREFNERFVENINFPLLHKEK